MTFVNEFIPAEDVEKYGLKEIDKHFIVGGTNARDWTIDRERDIYLRNVANGREDWRNQTKWTFYWRGEELTLHLDLLESTGEKPEDPSWSHWRLVRINGSYGLPEHLKTQKDEILETLQEALLVYGDFGVYTSGAEYNQESSVTLDIAEECVL
ncbi:hypothetical protein EBB59_13075 [Lysobacter pythonis]|uniref:Uncharacterized protein n=1 Tax=Solilutibacter pythonis TaxID=2483112 RepID=A0A3M2HKD5_9GAMM|nr:hypothetical protein [Lysobacter pythonis]RMH87402.1 hypothetical protein EBB59_13075 [Lysobacter pythonis]